MNTQVFTVHDSAANRFLEPFFAPTQEFAMRGFREAVNQEGHQFNKFPQDYTLFHIGEFDAESGTMIAAHPHSLGVAVTYMDPQVARQLNLLEEVADG